MHIHHPILRIVFTGILLAMLPFTAWTDEKSQDSPAQIAIPRVELMPNLPAPFVMRDWQKVTRDYVGFIFDFDKQGEHLPLVRWANPEKTMVSLPSYVGSTGGPEGINLIAAVVSGGLVGMEMTQFRGQNWVRMCTNYFNPQIGLYSNNPHGGNSGSFWYDMLPPILFYQLCDLFPGDAVREQQMRVVAERWREACLALGAKADPPALPNFDHTGFDLRRMQSVDNGSRIEPEGGAGIAWCEYMAWAKFHDEKFLIAADWSLRALEQKTVDQNPLYETVLPYGALTAARMNAELGRHYDVAKWINWCFEPMDKPQARPFWGILADRFGECDVHGLAGSVTDTKGYAFAMNGYQWAGALMPIARYDSRYARSLGKWMLNLANASRLFYPDALPADHQDNRSWADRYDPNYCVGYEGVRKISRRFDSVKADLKTVHGKILAGSFADLVGEDRKCEQLESETVGDREQLEQIWELALSPGQTHALGLHGHCELAGEKSKGFQFSYASQPDGPYTAMFRMKPTEKGLDKKENRYYGGVLKNVRDRVYIKVVLDEPAVAGQPHGRLHLDRMRVITEDPSNSPFATGDLMGHSDTGINFCLYGSSHVGTLGGIVSRTNQEKILRLDLLRTDYFHAPAWPTHLYYNPHPDSRQVTVAIGPESKDLYDAVSHQFLKRQVTGEVSVELKADSAVVLVLVPAGGKSEQAGGKLLVDGRVVDYRQP